MNGKEPEAQALQMRRRLWDLAREASVYLRRHASPAVRLTAALLLAASLAACNASTSDTTVVQTSSVAPLAAEVSTGLPRGPGTYDVVPGSVFRDQRGVYQFEWRDPGAAAGASGHVAHVSQLRLQRDTRLALAMVADADPVLHLPQDQEVGLIQEAGAAQPAVQGHPAVYSYWSPFNTGMLLYGRPAYYDPPRTIVVQQPPDQQESGGGSAGGGGRIGRVAGGSVSETPRPPAQRVVGLQTAVSGRAGGTGSGSAVTGRNITGGASSGVASGTQSHSVTAPRSSGFTSGIGSSGGGAAS